MGIKRIVDVQFWNDDKVLEYFSPEDKLFMLYLMTNPHTTQLGIYPINKKHMSFELGYTIEVISVLLDRFENKYNIIKYSNETKEIAIKNYLRHSIIKGGAPVRDCLIKEIKNVKNKELLIYVFSNLKQYEVNDTVTKLIEEYEQKNGELKYYNDNKKDNENENENENEVSLYDTSNDTFNDTSEPSISPKTEKSKVPYEEIKNLYHEICVSYPKVIKLSDTRKTTIKARYQEYKGDIDFFKTLFTKAETSEFLKGNNNNNWKANFDWLINPTNMLKVLEGNYDNKEANNNAKPKINNGIDVSKYADER